LAFDEKAANNLFEQIDRLWIQPELSRRAQAGILPKDFRIYRCLIRLPRDKAPIVEFNEEVGWIATARKPSGIAVEKGQKIFIHEIVEITAVKPPTVDEQRVAFVYVYATGNAWQIVFDFAPNVPESLIPDEEKKTWPLSSVIAESLQSLLIERVIRIHDQTQDLLRENGLWAAPALLPYPLSKIVKQLTEEDKGGASATLRNYCTPQWIKQLSSKWWSSEQFAMRRFLINEALEAHSEGKYGLSIHALLPQVEGIVSDYISTRIPEPEMPWRQESKTRKFRDLVLDGSPSSYTYQRIVQSSIDFIVSGPVLKSFKRWVDEIDEVFPGRNFVEHGKYDSSLFTEENSVKLILLLDTLYHIVTVRQQADD
jgi:hypothetical protein